VFSNPGLRQARPDSTLHSSAASVPGFPPMAPASAPFPRRFWYHRCRFYSAQWGTFNTTEAKGT